MSRSALARVRPQKIRTRLTALYVLLFLVAGSSLLALTYGLLASRLPATTRNAKNAALHNDKLLALCKQTPKPKILAENVQKQCERAFAAGASAGSQNQRDQTLNSLLLVSLIGLGLTSVASAGLGWVLSGRALRPIRAITETARRASELRLGERIALTGPEDELKELADTFDEMLERLDAAFASQKRFVANAAHELRTPLTAMRTSIEVTLSKPTRTPEQLEAMAAKVRRSGERAEATIDALLTLAMSEQGPATDEPLDLATVAEDALDDAAPSIAMLKLTVETALEPALTSGDPILLERMIANLVDNAVRHNNPNGWLRVHTAERNGDAMFEIENSGSYIPEHTIPSLFAPFARAEQRLNPLDGVGLGLSIADAIAIAHRSALLARCRPDGGLHVSIILPGAPSTVEAGA